MKPLIDESIVDPELLAALMEVERLTNIAKKAEHEAFFGGPRGQDLGEEQFLPEDNVNVAEVDPRHTENLHEFLVHEPGSFENINPSHVPVPEVQSSSITASDSAFEKHRSCENPRVLDINKDKASVIMNVPGAGLRPFQFLSVHDETSSQIEVYERCTQEMVVAMLNGFNSCVLCYGQTGWCSLLISTFPMFCLNYPGSGKTHTFFGPENHLNESFFLNNNGAIKDIRVKSDVGLVVRACLEIFKAREDLRNRGISLSISAQFIEIYDEQVTDLLSIQSASIRRETGEVLGAIETSLTDLDSVVDVLRLGHSRKKFAQTAMNDRSSRSHTAFIIHTLQNSRSTDHLLKSTLHLVDLAGSERVKKVCFHPLICNVTSCCCRVKLLDCACVKQSASTPRSLYLEKLFPVSSRTRIMFPILK